MRQRVGGVLSVTRALGDMALWSKGVGTLPYVAARCLLGEVAWADGDADACATLAVPLAVLVASDGVSDYTWGAAAAKLAANALASQAAPRRIPTALSGGALPGSARPTDTPVRRDGVTSLLSPASTTLPASPMQAMQPTSFPASLPPPSVLAARAVAEAMLAAALPASNDNATVAVLLLPPALIAAGVRAVRRMRARAIKELNQPDIPQLPHSTPAPTTPPAPQPSPYAPAATPPAPSPISQHALLFPRLCALPAAPPRPAALLPASHCELLVPLAGEALPLAGDALNAFARGVADVSRAAACTDASVCAEADAEMMDPVVDIPAAITSPTAAASGLNVDDVQMSICTAPRTPLTSVACPTPCPSPAHVSP